MTNILITLFQQCGAAAHEIVKNQPPVMPPKGAGWTDVIIVSIICLTALLIALTVFRSLVAIKKEKHQAELNQFKEEVAKEKEDRDFNATVTTRAKFFKFLEEHYDTDNEKLVNSEYYKTINEYLNGK